MEASRTVGVWPAERSGLVAEAWETAKLFSWEEPQSAAEERLAKAEAVGAPIELETAVGPRELGAAERTERETAAAPWRAASRWWLPAP